MTELLQKLTVWMPAFAGMTESGQGQRPDAPAPRRARAQVLAEIRIVSYSASHSPEKPGLGAEKGRTEARGIARWRLNSLSH